MQRWYAPGSGVFLISALQIGITFLLTLTKNRRIKWNFIKNILQAALIHGGYCLGHGLGLHLLLRQFHLPSFPDSIGHKFALPVSPAASSQRHICFLALVIYRYLERDLGNAFSYEAILDKLRTMNFTDIQEQGFIPLYTRDKLTNALHTICGFETDYRFITKRQMKNILKKSKGRK